MLPRHHRLTRPEDFRRTIRGGLKAATPSLIAYGSFLDPSTDGLDTSAPARVGVTVNKAVGGSVVRHRVARQIRHAMAAELPGLPEGSTWVIRALPQAASGGRIWADVHLAVARIVDSR